MPLEVVCPACGESDDLRGTGDGDRISLVCGRCGREWERSARPRCSRCGTEDVEPVPLAIVEKGRGTQLSVVGTRTIHLCASCDAERLARYHANRPNPLMPDALPTLPDGT